MKGAYLVLSLCLFFQLAASEAVMWKQTTYKKKIPSLKKLAAHIIIHNKNRFTLAACPIDLKLLLGYYYCRMYASKAWMVLAQSELIDDQKEGILSSVFIKANKAALAAAGGNLYIRDFKRKTCKRILLHRDHIRTCVLSNDKQYLVAGSRDCRASVMNLETDTIYYYTHPAEVTCVALSPDNKYLLTGTSDGKARLFDVQKGHDGVNGSSLLLFDHAAVQMSRVAFLTHGQIVTTCLDHKSKIWSSTTGQCIKTIGQTDISKIFLSSAMAPKGDYALVGYENRPVEFRHLQEDRCKSTELPHIKEHIEEKNIVSMDFNRLGSLVVLGSKDNHATLFAIDCDALECACKIKTKPLAVFNSHQRPVISVAISPNDASILCGDTQSTLLRSPVGTLKYWTFKKLARTLKLDDAESDVEFVLKLPEKADLHKKITFTPAEITRYNALPDAVRATIQQCYTVNLPVT